MSAAAPTALIADDEPLLRERLVAHLARLWPELIVAAQARHGREAIERFDENETDIAFLDVHMPGLNGIDVARAIGARAHIVFVTAYEQYAVTAFEQGALDYLVKPFDEARLATTVQRLRERLVARAGVAPASPGPEVAPLLEQIAAQLRKELQPQARQHLQWIKASVGNSVRLIPVDEVIFLRSDEKYTLVVWASGEALIRKTIRELADELDPARFVQIHRSVIVALPHVSHVVRNPNETADVHLHGRTEVLPVSRSWLHLFRQM
jgi:DNA-binding LytR/AlgR family response regulator